MGAPKIALPQRLGVDSKPSHSKCMRVAPKVVALLAVFLTLWSACVVVAHSHTSSIDAAKCGVCIAAHSAAPVVAAVSAAPARFSSTAVEARPLASRQRLVAFALSVRPPPSA